MKPFGTTVIFILMLVMLLPPAGIVIADSDTPEADRAIKDIATYNQKDGFLEIIDGAKKRRLGDAFYLNFTHTGNMDSLADKANKLVYQHVINPVHPPPYDERYVGSIFIALGISQISPDQIDQWVKDPRQKHILLYPRAAEVGLSVMSYSKPGPDMVIGIFLWERKHVRWPWGDSRYIRLLPDYYETSLLVYTGQVKSEVGFEPQKPVIDTSFPEY